ncbi:MAG: iron ABC transporter permease [Solobacterium sp.]|nr:iron ABC transporter permease [Solobacterium sp.]
MAKKKIDGWLFVQIGIIILFILFLVYPLLGIIKQSVIMEDGRFSLEQFQKFFENKHHYQTIFNSFKITITVTLLTLLLGIPLSYFYTFYRLKGSKLIFVIAILCSMSAPFLGAYSWVMLLGRAGVITKFCKAALGITLPSIYGFGGIVFTQTLKFFPLVFIYMNGAFRNIDNTLMEASENLGCTGIKRLFNVVMQLSMPTILAASLMVFMRTFADFGAPTILGEGYKTFPVLLYNEYLGENGSNYYFAAALSVIAVVITAVFFFIQKYATSKFAFSINALHPIDKKKAKGIQGFFMHLYSYLLCGLAVLPQLYIIYLSFRNSKGSVFKPGFSLDNYRLAIKKKLFLSTYNTVIMGAIALIAIILLSVLIAYVVVRRSSILSHSIDTIAMLPYIMPGAVIGISLLIAYGSKPLALTGTMAIMVLSFIIRRMPYTIRSATATLQQIPMSIEEAAISLGSSKSKTFSRITVPMMSSGILSGAILSWVAIVTELSSSVILYSNKTTTLTMQAYIYIGRGEYGTAAAFAAILTIITAISLFVYMALSKSEDVKI